MRSSARDSAGRDGESADIHGQQHLAPWQVLARRWERSRELLGAPTRRVSEWLVGQLAPRPGQTILELAAGLGETGFLAATHLGSCGRLISSDFAPAMVSAAKRVAKKLSIGNAGFRVLDAERLACPDASVDGVICRFGYMAMRDPDGALRETRRVLRQGGKLVLCVLGEPRRNAWMTVPTNAMIELGHVPRHDPGAPDPFRLRDSGRIGAALHGAGFSTCTIEVARLSYRFADADELWAFASELQGPMVLAIEALAEDERHAVRKRIEAHAAPFKTDSGYAFPGLVMNVVAA